MDLRKLTIVPDSPDVHPPHTVAARPPKDLGLWRRSINLPWVSISETPKPTTSREESRLLPVQLYRARSCFLSWLACSSSMNPADFDGQTSSRGPKEDSSHASHQALWAAAVLQRAKRIKERTDEGGGSQGKKGRAQLPVQHQANDRPMTEERPANSKRVFLKVSRGIIFYRSHTYAGI